MKSYVYEVMGSLPPEEGKQWRRNFTAHVVTDTVERSIELVHEFHDGALIHSVQRRDRTNSVIVDPRLSS